jgi:16S rRNA (cytidine1402-2'-O)-methyltransferase
VALVSDAGTPLVSDPGYRLAQQAIEAGYRVVPIPGASAPLAALVGSGLPNDAFLFAGFLPTKDKARRDRLAEFANAPATLLFFESPHRIGATLLAAAEVLGGGRQASVCRELTKTYEEFRRGTLAELAAHYEEHDNVKGEIVLVIGPPKDEPASETDVEAVLADLSKALPTARAATEAARLTGLPRKVLYQKLLDMKAADG